MAPSQKYFGYRGTALQYAVGIVGGVDMLLFGYDQGVMGGLLTLPSFTSVFPQICLTGNCVEGLSTAEIDHKSLIQGATVSSYNLGCFMGAIITIFIGDWLGRRRAIFLGSSTMVVATVIKVSSFSLGQFVFGRVLLGLGNGINTSTVPVWQSECSRSHQRGKMIMFDLAIAVGGVMISYWLDLGFSFLEPSSVAWRFPIAFQLVFTLFVLATVMSMPESPRWLILKGRREEALEVLAALNDSEPTHPEVLQQHDIILDTLQAQAKTSIKDLVTMGKARNAHRAFLGFALQMMQQITGINLVTYYAATIYENSIGLSPLMSRILAACNGTEYFIASCIPIFLVERLGRRPLLLVGSVGMALSFVVLTVTTNRLLAATNAGQNNTGASITAATFFFIFNTFFAVGWLGLPWLYPAEIVPLHIRAKANALSTSANWIFNFMVVMITPVAFASLAWKTYIIFAVINTAIVPVVYFLYPETALRSLEEIDVIFMKSKSFFDVVGVAKREPRRFGKTGEALGDLEGELQAQLGDGHTTIPRRGEKASHSTHQEEAHNK